MQGQGGRGIPCKFGDNCFKWKEGTCTFLHDNNQGGGQPRQTNNYNPNYGGGGRGGYDNNYQPNNTGGRGGNTRGYNNQQTGGRGGYTNTNNYNPNVPNEYNNGGTMGGRGGRGGRGGNTQNQNQGDNVTQEFCRNFQTGECTHSHCKRQHGFTKGDMLKRVLKMNQIPTPGISKLSTLEFNGLKYFTLRQDNVITVFQYNAENGQLNQLGENFVLEYPDIHWYDTRDTYVYFAYENKSTSFTNIGFIDVANKVRVTVDNAHKLKVTGIIHITDMNNQPLVLSSSIQGTIKAWKIQGDKLVLNRQITEGLQSCFKSNTNFEVLFLVKDTISGNQVLTAGTSDNRILFWIGKELSYKQIIFEEPHNKVLSVKYVKEGDNWVAMTIIWNSALTITTLMAISLASMQHQVLAQEQITGNNTRYLYTTLEAVGPLLLLGNMMGLVSIYKIPEFKERVGCIMHNNSVADMVSYASVTSTGIEMLNLLLLEKAEGQKQGSFSVYSYR